MEVELAEIQSFLADFPPFDELPETALQEAARQIEISYYREGQQIFKYGDPIHDLYIVRSGVVEVYRRKGDLYNRLDEGDIFGQLGLLMNNKVRFPAKATADSLIYCLPNELFVQFCDRYESFADFVEIEDRSRLRQAVSDNEEASDLTTSQVKTLLSRDPVLLEREQTVQEAAQAMAEEYVSAILVIDPEREQNEDQSQLVGIVTDSDLVRRVLSLGLPMDTPLHEVMSADLITLDRNAYVFEAMMLMLRYNVNHMPIVRKNKPLGLLEVTDIIRYESQSSLLLVNSIFRQQSMEELEALSVQVKDTYARMVQEDANSHMIGTAMSVIGRSFKERLLELAEEKYGPPPVPYCFLALGSMARDEQLIVTDQDNALILDDDYDPELHGPYFEKLARYVCSGLAACGYRECSGDIMAINPEWRKTRQEWEECFAQWIDNPDPQALLNSSIFFDLSGVYGRVKWAEQLYAFIVRRARKNNRFLACLARNAINRTPPLGFFRDFVMEQDGRHNNSINLKRRGTAPLADLVRVHALAVGSLSQNSFERLDDIIEAGILPKGRGEALRDAMEFISMVRIRHQAMDIETDIEPDNNIEPENMSDFERRNLKDAFQILSNAQSFIRFRYTANRMN